MAQMATATASVAVGSAVGPTLGHAITGGFSGGGNTQPAWHHLSGAPGSPAARPGILWVLLSWDQFLECSQNQSNIKLCKGFNKVLRQWRIANSLINKFKLKNWNGLYIIDSASSDPE